MIVFIAMNVSEKQPEILVVTGPIDNGHNFPTTQHTTTNKQWNSSQRKQQSLQLRGRENGALLMAIAEAYVTCVRVSQCDFFCKFYTFAEATWSIMDRFYNVNRYDIKYTMTINIDVEHISTTSVLFNYFLLLFNYYASILFADV